MGYDTLIIGAGMSGLAAGIRLAQFDRRVLIVERHSLWGGLNSFYKLKGRIFDSGLHALTNHVRKGTPGVPLTRILRQLRIGYDELELGAQGHSEIRFDGRRLEFTNQPEVFLAEIAREFPLEIDGLRRLVAELPGYDTLLERGEGSARVELARYLRDPDLIEILMLPLCIYGSAREDDLDWDQFVILFRAIFLEGFSRPEGGIKALLELLLARYKKVGGELRMNSGVERILVRDGTAIGVRLACGEEILAERVFSSAGH
ncbi:MAG: FAD-dependent oxidoreductase, partial [Planctomycetota bacterium]